MAERQEAAPQNVDNLWQLRLYGANAADVEPPTFDALAAVATTRVVHDEALGWLMTTGIQEDHEQRVCIAEIMVGQAAVNIVSYVDGVSITPSPAYDNLSAGTFRLPPSTQACRSRAWLRPGDRIQFREQDFTIAIERAEQQSITRVSSRPQVEVESSAVVLNGAHPGNHLNNGGITDESDDDDDLDAPVTHRVGGSQLTTAPYSTAQSTLQIVQETPTAVRTSRSFADASLADSMPTGSPNLAGSRMAMRSSPEPGDVPAALPALVAAGSARSLSSSIDGQQDIPQQTSQSPTNDSKDKSLSSRHQSAEPISRRGRPRKRPLQEIADGANADPQAQISDTKRRRKGAKATISGDHGPVPDVPAVSSRTPRSSGKSQNSSAASGPNTTSSYSGKALRVVFSNSSVAGKRVVSNFLQGQKVTIAQEIAAKSSQTNAQTICCIGVRPGEIPTTAKLLMALISKCLVVTDDWIEQSISAGTLLDPEDFVLEELEVTKDRSDLFVNMAVVFTQAARKSYANGFDDISNILKAAGAREVSIRAARDIDAGSNTIIIGLEKNDNDASALLQKDIDCYTKELITASILQAELLTEDPDFRLSAAVEPTKPANVKKKVTKKV
ncbi:hypothetical protein ANO11243_001450 [Dothideomycetidae sp. 11243]|nr:hypothetical protein ANO11243_001450 [fungal sp. No.11243]